MHLVCLYACMYTLCMYVYVSLDLLFRKPELAAGMLWIQWSVNSYGPRPLKTPLSLALSALLSVHAAPQGCMYCAQGQEPPASGWDDRCCHYIWDRPQVFSSWSHFCEDAKRRKIINCLHGGGWSGSMNTTGYRTVDAAGMCLILSWKAEKWDRAGAGRTVSPPGHRRSQNLPEPRKQMAPRSNIFLSLGFLNYCSLIPENRLLQTEGFNQPSKIHEP